MNNGDLKYCYLLDPKRWRIVIYRRIEEIKDVLDLNEDTSQININVENTNVYREYGGSIRRNVLGNWFIYTFGKSKIPKSNILENLKSK